MNLTRLPVLFIAALPPLVACPGPTGHSGPAMLIRTEAIAAGATCADGGTLIEYGLDDGAGEAAGNGVLDDPEVDGSVTVCNGETGDTGAQGPSGHSIVIDVDDDVGNACAVFGNHGGQRVRVGVDDATGGGAPDDGTLSEGEVDANTVICNGATGPKGDTGSAAAACTVTSDESTGTVTCPNGTLEVVAATAPRAGAYHRHLAPMASQVLSGTVGEFHDIAGREMTFELAEAVDDLRVSYNSLLFGEQSDGTPNPSGRCFLRILVDDVPCAAGLYDGVLANTPGAERPVYLAGYCGHPVGPGLVSVKVQWMQHDALNELSCRDGGDSYGPSLLEAIEIYD